MLGASPVRMQRSGDLSSTDCLGRPASASTGITSSGGRETGEGRAGGDGSFRNVMEAHTILDLAESNVCMYGVCVWKKKVLEQESLR